MLYQPLCHAKNEIRLLRVHPESTIGLISCELFHVSLDSSPAFLAISYAWGPALHTKNVFVNGKVHTVTASCWDVLHANTSLVEYQGMPIWIDAICINQEDEQEREREVLRMHWIYRRGFVAVNLGGGLRGRAIRARDRRAVRALELLAGRRSRQNQSIGWKTVDEASITDDLTEEEEEINSQDREEYINSSLSHITHFLNNPWFSRTWIIQEFTLGLKTPDAPLLSHGALISASTLVAACIALAKRTSCLPSTQQRALLVGISRYLRLANAAIMHMQGTAESMFLRFLCLFRDHGASDARDKVYSLLGLFQAVDQRPAYDSCSLPIDYVAPLEIVYARTVQSIVLATRRLDILCACQQSTSFSRSWTPDWRQPWRRTSINSRVGFGRNEGQDWRAAKDVEAQVAFSQDLRVMSARGVIYGEVRSVGTKWSARSVEDAPSVSKELDQLTSRGKERGMRKECETHDEYRDRSCNTNDSFDLTNEDPHSLFSSLEDAMAAGFRSSSSAPSNPLHFLPNSSAEWFDKAQRSCPLTRHFIKMSEGRRTMRTSVGSFGLGPEEMAVGDVVVVLFGCSVPVVLRPMEKCYEFVGECFVEGGMSGEVLDGLESGKGSERVFDIS